MFNYILWAGCGVCRQANWVHGFIELDALLGVYQRNVVVRLAGLVAIVDVDVGRLDLPGRGPCAVRVEMVFAVSQGQSAATFWLLGTVN